MALELDKYVIGLVILSVIVGTGIILIQETNESYGDMITIENKFDANFNLTEENGLLYNLSKNIKGSTLDKEIDEGDTPNTLFSGAFSAITFLGSTFSVMGNILDSIVGVLGIPGLKMYKTAAMTIISLLVGFAIVYLIFRFQPRR